MSFKKRLIQSDTESATKKQKTLASMPAEIIDLISDYLPDREMVNLAKTCKFAYGTLSRKLDFRYKTIFGCAAEGNLPGIVYWCDSYDTNRILNVPGYVVHCRSVMPINIRIPGKRRKQIFPLSWRWLAAPALLNAKRGLLHVLELLALLQKYLEVLEYAIEYGHLHLVRYFIEKYGQDIFFKDNSLIRKAVDWNRVEIAKYLLSLSEPDFKPFLEEETCLVSAAVKGHLNIIRYLTETFELKETCLSSVFSTACEHGHIAIVSFLFSHAEKHNRIYYIGHGFSKACEKGHLKLVRYLSIPRASVTVLTSENILDGFREACLNGRFSIIRNIMERMPTVTMVPLVPLLLYFVCEAVRKSVKSDRSLPILKYILRKFPRFFTADLFTDNFREACENGAVGNCQFLVLNYPGVPVDFYRHALMTASRYDLVPVVSLLLTGHRNGSFPGISPVARMEALDEARQHRREKVFGFLCSLPKMYPSYEMLASAFNENESEIASSLLKIRKKHEPFLKPRTVLQRLMNIIWKQKFLEMGQLLFSFVRQDPFAGADDPNDTFGKNVSTVDVMFKMACRYGFLELVRHMAEQVKCDNNNNNSGQKEFLVNVQTDSNVSLRFAIEKRDTYLVRYLTSLRNADGSDRIRFSTDHHAIICDTFSLGLVDIVEVLLDTPTTKRQRDDFLIHFISESVLLFRRATDADDQTDIFSPLFFAITELRKLYIASGSAGPCRELLETVRNILDRTRARISGVNIKVEG